MAKFLGKIFGKKNLDAKEATTGPNTCPLVSNKTPRIASTSHGTLTDPHMVHLSERIMTEDDLVKLGVTGLKLPFHKIQTALTNNPKDITSAAHVVLQEWFKQQENMDHAFTDLQAALHRCEMNNLASQLATHFSDENQQTQMSTQRFEGIKRWTKESFTTSPFCRSFGLDWTPPPRRPAPNLMDVHTNVRWTRKHRKAYTVEQEDLQNITQILSEGQLGDGGPVRILVQGKGGIGKSTAMKYLALTWAKGSDEDLKRMDFIFHISLKHVRDNSSIEDIIIKQHSGLHSNKVTAAEIKAILENGTKGKFLIILDGHDEYKHGRNKDIDEAIEKQKLWNCWMIVTSRESEQIKHVKECMDAEAEIHGFDEDNIKHYLTKSLGSKEKCDALWREAMKSRLIRKDDYGELEYNILDIPLFLHMICSLFISNQTLPETRTKIIEAMVHRCIDREAIRETGQKPVDDTEQLFINLGRLAWQGLNDSRGPRLVFSKEEVDRLIGEDVSTKYGLLVPVEGTFGEENFTFHHLLFQQFFAGKFLASLNKESWEELFPSSEEVMKHGETVIFACGVMDQPEPLIELICDRIASKYRQIGYSSRVNIEIYVDNIESQFLELYDLLAAMAKEITKSCNVHPLNNMCINYVSSRHDTVFVPSKFYVFHRGPRNTGAVKYVHDRSVLRTSECAIITSSLHVFETIFEIGKMTQIGITHLVVDEGRGYLIPRYCGFYGPDDKKAKRTSQLEKRVKMFRGESRDLCSRSNTATEVSQSDERFQTHWKKHVRLSENAQVVVIRNSPLLMKHVTPQLCTCNHLQFLCLTDTELPEELGQALPRMKDLKSLFLQKCKIEPILFKTIVKQLTVCEKLKALSFKQTLNIPIEIGETLPRLTSLKCLDVSDCKMPRAASEALLQSLTRCPMIEHLNLDDNILTGLLDKFLSVAVHHKLRHLYVSRTGLSESDVRSVAMAASANKLPNLRMLDISVNTLTGLVGVLMGGADHPGYTSLEGLYMHNIRFSKDDTRCLSQAVTAGKLPRLRLLVLLNNNLHVMTEEDEHFVRSCVKCYSQRRVLLILGQNKLTGTFIDKLKSIVQGTRILLTFFSKTREEARQRLRRIGFLL